MPIESISFENVRLIARHGALISEAKNISLPARDASLG
jgi:hypothetical protein